MRRTCSLLQIRERALALVPVDSPAAARLLSVLGKSYARRSYEEAVEALERSLEIAQRLGRADLEVQALQYRAVVERRYLRYPAYVDIGERAVEATRKTGDAHLFLHGGALVAGWALMHGDRAAAERRVRELVELPGHVRVGYWGGELRILRLRPAAFKGRWEETRGVTTEAVWSLGALGVLPLIKAEIGEAGAEATFLDAYDKKPDTFSESVRGPYLLGLATLARLSGSTTPLDTIREQGGIAIQRLRASFGRIHALVALGLEAWLRSDLVTLESLCGDEPAAPPHQMMTMGSALLDRLRGLFAGALGRDEQARAYFESALSFCRNAGFLPELGWSCLDYADFLTTDGESKRAKVLVAEGLEPASRLAMVPLSRELKRPRERLEGQAPDGLTKRELEVLGLAASGRSNQEIAAELLISYHTAVNGCNRCSALIN